MSERIAKINSLLQHHLAELLMQEVEFPGNCLVTVTSVTTSKDLRHAKVWLSVLPTFYSAKALAAIRKQAGNIQHQLNKKLSMKPLPRLSFAIDDTEREAADIDALLDQIKRNE